MVFNRLTSEETEFEQYTGTPSVIYENSENWKITFNTVSGDNWSDQGFYLAFYDKESWDDNLGDYSDLSYFGLGSGGTNSVYDDINNVYLLPNVNNTASTLTILRNRNYIIFTITYSNGKSKSKYITASNTHNRVRFEGQDITDYMGNMSEPTMSQSLSEAQGLSSSILANIGTIKDTIKHKLDVADITYSNGVSLTDATYLLNNIDSTATQVSKPSYNNNVSGLASNFNNYKTFLTSILSNQGFSTASTGLTSLVGNIRFTPTLTVTSSPSSFDVGDTVTVTATLDLNGSPISGASVEFYDASDDSLLDTVTTDVNGEAEYTFTYSSPLTVYCVSGETSDYINVSSSNMEVVSEYLFYDECNNASNLSLYNSSIPIYYSEGVSTMTYDSTENAYLITGSGKTGTGHMIPSLEGVTGYKIEAEFKLTGNSTYDCVGFVVRNKNATDSTWSNTYTLRGNKASYTAYNRLGNSSGTSISVSTNNSNQTWAKLVLTIPSSGSTYNLATYDSTGTFVESKDITCSLSVDSDIQMGLYYRSLGKKNVYVRNIKAERL